MNLQRASFGRSILLVLVSAYLGACGGGGGGDQATAQSPTPSPPGSPNTAPKISGKPATTVLVGQAYSFQPAASDTDGDALTFAIAGLPPWAAFDAASGKISGTPSAADVGTYRNVTISVNDGTSTTALPSFDISVVATSPGSATLSWQPPTQNSDGSPLTDLAGYKVYWGTAPDSYSSSVLLSNPGLTTYVVEPLTAGTWYFVTTAVNSAGIESPRSNAATKTIL